MIVYVKKPSKAISEFISINVLWAKMTKNNCNVVKKVKLSSRIFRNCFKVFVNNSIKTASNQFRLPFLQGDVIVMRV